MSCNYEQPNPIANPSACDPCALRSLAYFIVHFVAHFLAPISLRTSANSHERLITRMNAQFDVIRPFPTYAHENFFRDSASEPCEAPTPSEANGHQRKVTVTNGRLRKVNVSKVTKRN